MHRNCLKGLACLALAYAGSTVSEPVYRDGRTWLQPAIPPTSWNVLNSLCPPPAALCTGSVGDTDLTGYTWATASEVQALFASYGAPTFVNAGAPVSAVEQASSNWAPRIISDFAHQGGDFESQVTSGMVSSGPLDGPERVVVTDRDSPSLPDRVAVESLASAELEGSTFGGWFWRDDLADPRPVILNLEEPVDGEAISGIGNLRGYALGLDGIARVEIYIDDEYVFDAPYGGLREDVEAAFGEVPGSALSGFSLAYGYANLTPGEHTITARAITPQGKTAESTATFTVLAFQQAFIFPNQPVVIPSGSVTANVDELYIEDLSVDGEIFDVTLRWRTATQGFEMVELR